MPRTKPRPEPAREPAPRAGMNGPADNVLNLGEAAAYLRLPENEVLRMVHEQGLHGRQVGTEWRFLKSAIDDWLRTGPQPLSNKEAWLALAGAWKDDPTVDALREEIQKWRRQIDAEVNR